MQLTCPVCDRDITYFGTSDYYLPGIPRLLTSLFSCSFCGALYRHLPEDLIRSHCDTATYTNPHYEDRFWRQRITFFRHLVSLITREMGYVPYSCLDFGCSYGHFLLQLREMRCAVSGIEVCQHARDICRRHGVRVYGGLEDIDSYAHFDIITLIDSLYYVTTPRTLLSSIRGLLSDKGVLLIRIANRNWILHSLKTVAHRDHFGNWLGDATVGYSSATLRILLQNTGFRIVGTHYWEPGKQHPDWRTGMFYWLSSVVTYASLGSLKLTPGIIVLATKDA